MRTRNAPIWAGLLGLLGLISVGAMGCGEQQSASLPTSDTVPQSIQPNDPEAGKRLDNAEGNEPARPTMDADATKDPNNEQPHVDIKQAAKNPSNDQPVQISFDDLNLSMQADVVFRPWMLTDRVKDLEGKVVRLSGYIHAGVAQSSGIKEFVLLRNTECLFGPGGQADHLVQVQMKESSSAKYTTRPVEVDGVLVTAPFEGPDGNTWAVFRIDGMSCREVKRR